MVSLKDNRIKELDRVKKPEKDDPSKLKVMEKPQISSALFFSYNTQLGPPYHVILGKLQFYVVYDTCQLFFLLFQTQISSTSV